MLTKSWKVSEIAGFEVFDETGQKLGVLIDVLPTKANDVFVVKSDLPKCPEILIPALFTVILEIDILNKKIIVNLPKGLKEIYEVRNAD
ncbi:MAG: PRC-barrel domain-containing protein [Elusimicrobia bacterium]|nr:PRC-barrel domain-containing protein [Elusimicrobiota bacterium]